MKQLSSLLAQVKDEQSYIVVRERTHRNTAESTNARVKWWSIFQLGVLIGEGIFQVWWLKRFFEVRFPDKIRPRLHLIGSSLTDQSVACCRSNELYSLDHHACIIVEVKRWIEKHYNLAWLHRAQQTLFVPGYSDVIQDRG